MKLLHSIVAGLGLGLVACGDKPRIVVELKAQPAAPAPAVAPANFQVFGVRLGEPLEGQNLQEQPLMDATGERWVKVVLPVPYRGFTNGQAVLEGGRITQVQAAYRVPFPKGRKDLEELSRMEMQGVYLSAAVDLEAKYGVSTNKTATMMTWERPEGKILLSCLTHAEGMHVAEIRYISRERVDRQRQADERRAKERTKML